MQKTILVIGATGMLGEPVARRLKEDGFRARVMTRDRDKAQELFGESFEIVVGDVMDTNSLGKSLDGCFGVHISLSPPEIERAGVENILSLAPKYGIKRITYVSADNVSEEYVELFPPFRQKLLAERAIRESGIPYTIFCPTASMESLSMFVEGGKAGILGKQPHPYHWLAGEDLGRVVSAAFKLEEAVNKRFFIYGPEGIRTHEALKRYCSVFYPEIKKISTMPYWLVNLIATITRNNEMKFGVKLLAFCEKTGECGDPTEANSVLGAPKTTLDEWLTQRKAKVDESSTG